MQHTNQRSIELRKKLAKLIKEARIKTGKSCNKVEEEFDIGSGVLNRIENAKYDCKFITLWKVCEALEINFLDLILSLKNELGNNFNLIDK